MAQTRTSPHAGRVETREARIGSAARVRGRIHGDGDLIVEGHVDGDLAIRGDLTVAEGGSVKSEGAGRGVEAHAVTIAGTLTGDVAASGPVRLAGSAQVSGNLRGSAVAIDEGARFAGRLDCEFDLPPELGGASGTGGAGKARGASGARR